jgi:hypothetical protein
MTAGVATTTVGDALRGDRESRLAGRKPMRLLVILLLLLLLVGGLPLPMGMDMPSCPDCSFSEAFSMLGLCAAILGMIGLVVALLATLIRPASFLPRRLLLVRPLERPPRAI